MRKSNINRTGREKHSEDWAGAVTKTGENSRELQYWKQNEERTQERNRGETMSSAAKRHSKMRITEQQENHW